MHEITRLEDFDKMKGGKLKTIVQSRFVEMDLFYNGKILVVEQSSDIHLLKNYGVTEGLTQGIPPEAIVAHRIGNDRLFEIFFLANNDYATIVFIHKFLCDSLIGWKSFLDQYGEPSQKKSVPVL